MPHTYSNLLVHCVFSTKQRRNLISADVQPRLWAFMGGIARQNGFKALAVGGTSDHAHVLLSLPPRIAVAKAVQLVKAGSSKWMRQKHARLFSWQECYGAFTIGASQVAATVRYIAEQQKHHARRDYRAEFVAFLERNGVAYDPERIDA